MTRVFFYHLTGPDTRFLPLLCSLVSNAMGRGLDVFVHTPSASEAGLLYTSLEQQLALGSSLALGCGHGAPVTLCWGDDPGHHHGLLVNLRPDIAPWFSRFDQLAELVWGEEHFVASKREIFRLLRHRGYPLEFHSIASDSDNNASDNNAPSLELPLAFSQHQLTPSRGDAAF